MMKLLLGGEIDCETVSLGVGDSVLYTSSGQQPQLVRILKVHFDDPPEPYYTIDIGGVERETIGSHLRPACFPEDASLSRSSRSHKEEVKVELPKKRQLRARLYREDLICTSNLSSHDLIARDL